jgi:plasmid stabilization system protein ParE
MKVVYSRRAISDLDRISSYYREVASLRIAAAIGARIQTVIERIADEPKSSRQLVSRPGVYIVPIIRYPYKIFYEIKGDHVEILHIRHASRRPWGED